MDASNISIARFSLRSLLAATLALSLGNNATLAADWNYTVKQDDNLIRIGQKFLEDPAHWEQVQKLNRIEDPYRLRPGSILNIPVGMLRYRPSKATLETIHGDVRWRQVGVPTWQAASDGQSMASGVEIETGQDSSALLRLVDSSTLLLSANSKLEIGKVSQFVGAPMGDTMVRLQRGLANITANPEKRANQKLKVLTPSAQAVVRGTHFRVAYGEDTTREETLSGLVEVSAGTSSVQVASQQGTLARQGEAPTQPVRLLDAPDVSALASHFEQLPLQFALPEQVGVASWVAEVAPDVQFRQILVSTTAIGSRLNLGELPDGSYALRLRAVDARGMQGQDALHRFTVNARPLAPTLQSPVAGALVRYAQPTLTWGKVPEATAYRVQVGQDRNFTSIVYDVRTEQPDWQPGNALPPSTLYWRVASIAQQRQGPWSALFPFAFKPGPGPIELGQNKPHVEANAVAIDLPAPPSGLVYQATLSPTEVLSPITARIRSTNGTIRLPRPQSGTWYLALRLLDPIDDVPGFSTVQKITVP